MFEKTKNERFDQIVETVFLKSISCRAGFESLAQRRDFPAHEVGMLLAAVLPELIEKKGYAFGVFCPDLVEFIEDQQQILRDQMVLDAVDEYVTSWHRTEGVKDDYE